MVPGLADGAAHGLRRRADLAAQLRRGLRYSDGTPLRANDLVRSLRRVRALSPTGRRLFARVDSVEADDRTGSSCTG